MALPLLRKRLVDPEAYVKVKRLILGAFLMYVLWLMIPNIIAYTTVLRDSSRQLQATKLAAPSASSVPSVPSSTEITTAVQRIKEDAARKQASIGKVTARKLESQLVQKKVVSATARIHCAPVVSDWDYVCNYLPTPKTSSTRVQFGVQVDRQSWVQISPIVPEGTMIPSPAK